MELVNELPYDLRWDVIKFMTHPLADAFKQELEDDLDLHFRVYDKGLRNQPIWCSDDDELFAWAYLWYHKPFWRNFLGLSSRRKD